MNETLEQERFALSHVSKALRIGIVIGALIGFVLGWIAATNWPRG